MTPEKDFDISQLTTATNWPKFLTASRYANRSLKRFVNRRWKRIFGRDGTLSRLRLDPGDRLYTNPGQGLIYFYLVDGRVRYVGQTRARSLKARLTRWRPAGRTGYNFAIKRLMLTAYYQDKLRVKTLLAPIGELDRLEDYYIKAYGQQNKLWNQIKNPGFRLSNYKPGGTD